MEKRDIFLRAHTVMLDGPAPPERDPSTSRTVLPKWAGPALVFGTEARTGISQNLTLGFHRVMKLHGDEYVLEEEGAFCDDGFPAGERRILETYLDGDAPDVVSFPPRFPLLSRAEFINKAFYRCARKGALIVGFDICPSLARLARKWPAGE